jgi:hypothetical protein
VIVPATDHPPYLGRCRAAIEAALGPADELIVVERPELGGPAAARNAGSRSATGDVLVFVDSDVVVRDDALARVRGAFAGDAALTALFGSYDDSPEAPGTVSGFRNLLHHHVHQSSRGPTATFWAGLGAVRREPFEAVGGFDERTYLHPSVEDIELGLRLDAAGARIELDPDVQGTHLKLWTLAGMVRTDFARRGAPWVALLARGGRGGSGSAPTGHRGALNLGWRHRVSAAAALTLVVSSGTRRPAPALAGAAVLLALNRSLYGLLLRQRGPRQAAAGVALHAIHHLTAVASVPAGLVGGATGRVPAPIIGPQ